MNLAERAIKQSSSAFINYVWPEIKNDIDGVEIDIDNVNISKARIANKNQTFEMKAVV